MTNQASDKSLEKLIFHTTDRVMEELAKQVNKDGPQEIETEFGTLQLFLKPPPLLDFDSLTVGQKVYYQPKHYNSDEWENGIIKEIPTHTNEAVRVVYNCNNDWDNYQNYTSALTKLEDLKLGWK